MRNRTLSPGLALLILFAISCPAFAQVTGKGALDSGVRDVVTPDGKKGQEFHCKIPDDYGVKKRPEALSKNTDEDLGEGPPPPPPPDPNLCLTDPAKFYEEQAKSFYEKSVLNSQTNPPRTDAPIRVDGARDVSLKGTVEELRIFKRLLGDGLSSGKKPLLSGPASWPSAADSCASHDVACALSHLYDLAGACTSDKPCDGRESAYLSLDMAKTTKYFPTLTQWYPTRGPGGEDWTQHWDVKTLRTMTHAFQMLPSSASRLAVDKDLRKFPPGSVIGDCPSGSSACKPNEAWPVPDGGGRSTIGMAQIFFFTSTDAKPAGYSDAYILVTDKLVNADRMVTCKGLVHELTHHFDYSFMFDTSDLNGKNTSRQATLDRLSREWGVKTVGTGVKPFGKYSSLAIADPVSGEFSSFAELSWSCQRPGEGCAVKADETAGFVSDYAHQVGPMDDFAESVSHYVCDPVELLLRSPQKYTWLKTHLFADRSAAHDAPRDFWFPDHEKWKGFDDSLKVVAAGSEGSDALLTSCLDSFKQFQAQSFKWTTGPNTGQSFSKVAAFFPDRDPTKRQNGSLEGFFAADVLSEYNCVAEVANKIDSEIQQGMRTTRRPDLQYCGMGSQEAVQYLTAKRAGYVASPFFQALANLGLKDKEGTIFQSLSTCKAETRDSCTFLKAFNQELDGFRDALNAAGLTAEGKTKGIAKVLELLRNGS